MPDERMIAALDATPRLLMDWIYEALEGEK